MTKTSETKLTINAPVEKVWQVLMDPANLKHWLTGFVSIEHLSGTPDEPGSTSKIIFQENGRKVEAIETVTAIKPLQQYSISFENKSFTVLTDIRLAAKGNRTEFTQVEQVVFKSFFMKLLMPFIKGAMEKRRDKDLARLKAYIEQRQV